MSYTSDFLAIILQETNDNPDSWGQVLTDSTIRLMERAFIATDVSVTAGNVTLAADKNIDAATHYRYGILNITGSPGAARDVILPVGIKTATFVKKHWLVVNSTTGGQVITFKTATGSGVPITDGKAMFCHCDGTDILASHAASSDLATLAASATLAADSTLLGGVAAASYVQDTLYDTRNTWTKGQVVQREILTDVSTFVTPTLNTSNAFYVSWAGNWTLNPPTGAVNGDNFSIVVQQAAGAPHTITFAGSTYLFEGGVTPVLSTLADKVDYLAFEYCSNIVGGGGQWLATFLKDLS